jgi:2-keto-4-pentenoate hydratase/2-oxohepta-3-ene-1,7-dioic acid hydratase in catechol pathway
MFGIAIANDLSARDVQLPQTQFFKRKDLPTAGFVLSARG